MKRQVYDRILERAGRAVFLVCNLNKGIEEKGTKERNLIVYSKLDGKHGLEHRAGDGRA